MIYLDNSATTPPCEAAVLAAREMLEEMWQNPSAPYREAVAVERKLAACRQTLAEALGAKAREVVFTGSGTEADCLAILGSAQRLRGPGTVLLFAAEHPAVRNTAQALEAMGHTVQWIPATPEGVADIQAFSALLTVDTALVSCMQVGNETGAVQPIRQMGQMMGKKAPQALFHVDGIQGFLRLPLDLDACRVDLYSVSAHKVHGPKGVGALYVRQGVKMAAITPGGGQEGGLRSGTENTAGIAAFAAAVAWIREQAQSASSLRAMKLRLYERLLGEVEGLRVNGPDPASEASAPHILNVSFPGVGGEVLLHALEAEGVLVGTGAACSSKKRAMSAAFSAMKAPQWAADSAIRISLSPVNTMQEVETAAEAVLRCYQRYKAFQRR